MGSPKKTWFLLVFAPSILLLVTAAAAGGPKQRVIRSRPPEQGLQPEASSRAASVLERASTHVGEGVEEAEAEGAEEAEHEAREAREAGESEEAEEVADADEMEDERLDEEEDHFEANEATTRDEADESMATRMNGTEAGAEWDMAEEESELESEAEEEQGGEGGEEKDEAHDSRVWSVLEEKEEKENDAKAKASQIEMMSEIEDMKDMLTQLETSRIESQKEELRRLEAELEESLAALEMRGATVDRFALERHGKIIAGHTDDVRPAHANKAADKSPEKEETKRREKTSTKGADVYGTNSLVQSASDAESAEEAGKRIAGEVRLALKNEASRSALLQALKELAEAA